jgi:hypothetical protein
MNNKNGFRGSEIVYKVAISFHSHCFQQQSDSPVVPFIAYAFPFIDSSSFPSVISVFPVSSIFYAAAVVLCTVFEQVADEGVWPRTENKHTHTTVRSTHLLCRITAERHSSGEEQIISPFSLSFPD